MKKSKGAKKNEEKDVRKKAEEEHRNKGPGSQETTQRGTKSEDEEQWNEGERAEANEE